MLRSIVLLSACWMVLPASAQRIQKSGHFGLSTAPFRYESASSGSIEGTDLLVGLGAPGLGLTFGGATSERVDLNVSLLVAHRTLEVTSTPEDDFFADASRTTEVSATELHVLPGVDYVFPSDESPRAFLGARLGVTHTIPDSGTEQTSLILGPELGAHAFVGPHASIDFAAHGFYLAGLGDNEVTGFSLGVTLGVTAWWGGAADEAGGPRPGPTGPSAEASDSALPSSPAPSVRSEAERAFDRTQNVYVLRGRFALGDGAQLLVASAPQHRPDKVYVQLWTPSAPARHCPELAALINERPFPTAELVEEQAGKLLRGHLTSATFAALLQQHPTFGVEACGQQWRLAPAQMPDMLKFLQLVAQVEQDVQQGKLPGPPAAPPSPPPSQEPAVPAAPGTALEAAPEAAPAAAPAPIGPGSSGQP